MTGSGNSVEKGEDPNEYLIIGGVPKAGTTSLFSYLADHPAICPADRKETYFFARQFDLMGVGKQAMTMGSFEYHFKHCPDEARVRIEATPYTIYASGAAEQIACTLPTAKMIFVLREPVQRFISAYFFAKQRGHPSTQGTLEDYMEWQKWIKDDIPNEIEMGCYSTFLGAFFAALGETNIKVILFRDFVEDTLSTMHELCRFIEIEPDFYEGYEFGRRNTTIVVRSDRLNRMSMRAELAVAKIRGTLMQYPLVHSVFEKTVGLLRTTYYQLNAGGGNQKKQFDENTKETLSSYYRPHNEALSEFLGRPLPW